MVSDVENTWREEEVRKQRAKKEIRKELCACRGVVDPSGWRSLRVYFVVSVVWGREGGGGGVGEGSFCKHLMGVAGYSYVIE